MLTRAQAARQRRELWRDIAREERKQAREKIARLRAAVREARAARTVALREAAAQCRADRLSARARAQEVRATIAADLRLRIDAEYAAAREACAERARETQRIRDHVVRTRAELAAARQHQKELRAIQRRGREQFVQAVREAESDTDVRAQIAPPLVPLFEAVKHGIEATPDASRLEAFLRHAETHPADVLAAMEHPTEIELRNLEQSHAAAVRAYEQRKARRVEGIRRRAARLKTEAQAAGRRAQQVADVISLGQPILLGHHSEKRHRRDLRRIDAGFRKAMQLQKEAQVLERRDESAETNRAIFSDDPDAGVKLRQKLEQLEKDRARMVAASKAARSKDPRAALGTLGYSAGRIDELLTPDFAGRKGFPDYALRNAAAEAARVRKGIAEIEARRSGPVPTPIELHGVRVEESDNRVRIYFSDKPDDTMRDALKRAGFRWSPTVGAWQRHASTQAWRQAQRLVMAGGPSATTMRSPLDRVLEAIDAERNDSGLSFVPNVVRRLAPELDMAAAKRALLDAATRGLVELRPEAGLGRLSEEELDASPAGPQGSRLTWARHIGEGSL
jgi:hypothetical protein